MTFELEADGVRVWCSSPAWTRKLVEKGARLVNPAQAAYLDDPEEHAKPARGRSKKRQRSSTSRKAPAAR